MAMFNAASAFLASIAVDQNYLTLRDAILVFAMSQIVIGLLFTLWMRMVLMKYLSQNLIKNIIQYLS